MGTNRICIRVWGVLLIILSGMTTNNLLAQNQDYPENHFAARPSSPNQPMTRSPQRLEQRSLPLDPRTARSQQQFQGDLPRRMPPMRSVGYSRMRQDDPFGEEQNLPPTEPKPNRLEQELDPFADPPKTDEAAELSDQVPPPANEQDSAAQDPFGEAQNQQPQPREVKPRQLPVQPRQNNLGTPTRPRQVPPAEYPPGSITPDEVEGTSPAGNDPRTNRQPNLRQPNQQQPAQLQPELRQSQPYQEPAIQWDPNQDAPPAANYQPVPNQPNSYPQNYQQPQNYLPNQPARQNYAAPYGANQYLPAAPYSQATGPQPTIGNPYLNLGDQPVYQGVAGREVLTSDSGYQDCGFDCGTPMFYFSLFAGNVNLQDMISADQSSQIFSDNGPGFGLALGQRHGNNLRSELEFSYRDNDLLQRSNLGVTQDIGGSLRSYAGMANVYWEFMNFPHPCFKPYVGAGIGFASLEMSMNDLNVRSLLTQNGGEDTSLAYQFMGGVNYKAYRNVDLFIEYRLFQADSFRVDSATGFGDGKFNYDTDNLFAGLRWKF